MNIKKQTAQLNGIIFIVAIAAAVVGTNICIRRNIDMGCISLSVYNLPSHDNTGIQVMLYVLITRFKQFIIMVALMKLFKAETVLKVMIALLGVMYGCLSCVQTYYDGFMGVLLLLIYILPHYIFYTYLMVRTSAFISGKTKEHRYAMFFIFAFVIILAGVFMECIISRFFLNKFYQYMVM